MRILVTGGCGFIGSNFIDYVLNKKGYSEIELLLNVDSLTYAGRLSNMEKFKKHKKYRFKNLDITSANQASDAFQRFKPTHVVHFAAETHVDNSIKSSLKFLRTNIDGTHNLIKSSLLAKVQRFHHVSTDEVFGSLGSKGKFKESTPYDPRNPYSASKAASDHLVRAFHHTYGLPITISNCSNNYGPNQHKEKFIPTILNSLKKGNKIPVYGNGSNVRDWIYVEDHCDAIWKILTNGKNGETYNVGSNCEKTNLEVIEEICKALKLEPSACIQFVKDRAGHDLRYAIDSRKIKKELNWKPSHSFKSGIKKNNSLLCMSR